MIQKSPAFQFYAKDFLTGTATMSLEEVGAYVKLLAYQWDAGSIPDSPRDRTRILGCTAAHERAIWLRIASKFVCVGDAYRNTRLEEEREKQAEYRRRQSDKGKASAATRRQPESNHGSTTVKSRLQPEGQPKGNSSSSSSSSSSKKQEQQAAAPLIKSPAYVEKRRIHCAFVGSKLEVPLGLHAELRTALGGPDPEKALQDWYLELNETAEVEAWRMPIDTEIFKWLKAQYAQKFPAPVVNGAKSITDEIDEWARS